MEKSEALQLQALQAEAIPSDEKDRVRKNPVFVTGSIARHILTMASSSCIGIVCMFSVDLVDMIFISMLHNESLMAAIGFAGSIFFITRTIGLGMSMATNTLVSRSVGAGEINGIQTTVSSAYVFVLVCSFLVSVLILVCLNPLIALMGASGETAHHASQFLWIVVPSMPLISLSMATGSVLRAHGDAKRAMVTTMVGALAQAIIDPLLIFGCELDLRGAALAQVISRCFQIAYALVALHRTHQVSLLTKLSANQLWSHGRALGKVALPAVLGIISNPLSNAYVINQAASFGTSAVSGMAVTARLTPVAFAVVFGLQMSVAPIVGQNVGANRLDRVKTAYQLAVLFALCYVLIAVALLVFLRSAIGWLFDTDDLAKQVVDMFCGPLSLLWFFNAVIGIGNSVCNNLKYPVTGMCLLWARQTIGLVPPIYLFANTLQLGVNGILIGREAGAVPFALISTLVVHVILHRHGRSSPGPIDGTPTRMDRIALFGSVSDSAKLLPH